MGSISDSIGETYRSAMFNNAAFCEGCEQVCCRAPYVQMFATKEIVKLDLPLDVKKKKFAYSEELTPVQPFGVIQSKTCGVFLAASQNDGSCAFLQNKRCEIYENRGLDCRIFPYFFEYNALSEELIFYLDSEAPCISRLTEGEIQKDLPEVMEYVGKEIKHWSLVEVLAYSRVKPNARSGHPRELGRMAYKFPPKAY